ncbi:MAG: hypothetical protein ACRYHQ_32555 [Janthinobacterium lividum]
MADHKLSPKMVDALAKIVAAGGSGSAYGLRISLGTMQALRSRGMLNPVGRGHGFCPTTGEWRVTAAGRNAAPAPVRA